MIANSAFLAAMVVILLLFAQMGALQELAPYKHVIFPQYLWEVVGATLIVFLNLVAAFYSIARRLFLKDTGRKLAHVDKQLHTADTIVADLSDRLAEEE